MASGWVLVPLWLFWLFWWAKKKEPENQGAKKEETKQQEVENETKLDPGPPTANHKDPLLRPQAPLPGAATNAAPANPATYPANPATVPAAGLAPENTAHTVVVQGLAAGVSDQGTADVPGEHSSLVGGAALSPLRGITVDSSKSSEKNAKVLAPPLPPPPLRPVRGVRASAPSGPMRLPTIPHPNDNPVDLPGSMPLSRE